VRRWIRGTVNAILVATLVKPMTRWMIARARRNTREFAAATVVIPVQEFFEGTVAPRMMAKDAALPVEETIEEVAEQSALRTVLIVGAAGAVIVGTIAVVATIVRRRRRAAAEATGASGSEDATEWVAVPVEQPSEEPEPARA
jgi:hypothetical protein